MRIISVKNFPDNPYQRLFYEALSHYGFEMAEVGGPVQVRQSWLDDHANQFEIVHFHWPEFLVGETPSFFQSLYSLRGGGLLKPVCQPVCRWYNVRQLKKFVVNARKMNKKILWTIHNLVPHDQKSKAQSEAFRIIAQHSDLVICHDDSAAEEVTKAYHTAGKVLVMPHGNYDGAFPEPAKSRETICEEFGLSPGKPLYCCVGQIRKNKGFDLAVKAIKQHFADSAQLIIAGRSTADQFEELESLARGCSNISVVNKKLSDQEFVDLNSAADAVFLPYRSVTGSGALLAAFTLGKSVIASDMPYFRNLLDLDRNAGTLFKPEDSDDLARAIVEFQKIKSDVREKSARNLADRFAWKKVVEPVAAAIS